MENVFLSDTFWSAVKRKNLPDVLEIVFVQAGLEDAAKVAHDTNAMTAAAILRMKSAMGEVPEIKEDEVVEETMAKDVEPTYADEASEVITVGDIKMLIASGKKKNIKAAKKAFKKQFAKGHPQHKEIKNLLKEVA